MRLRVNNQPKKQQIKKGDIVTFPQYGTSYVVHSADQAAQNTYSISGGLQLYRFDGQKAYRKLPFTEVELTNLIENLHGEVYCREEYDLELVRR